MHLIGIGVRDANRLIDPQNPAVSDTHPVVSAQSQLSTCEEQEPFFLSFA